MKRLSIACFVIALVVACSGKGKKDTTGSGSGSARPVIAKKIWLSWGIAAQGEMSDVFLETTDETGKRVSHAVGAYKGKCVTMKPAPEMNAVTGVACTPAGGGGGTELHAVVRGGDEIIVVQMGTQPGTAPDPMAREEVTRVKVPLGIAIEVAE